jgi:hypothetical protein
MPEAEPEKPVIEFWVKSLPGDDPTSFDRCTLARGGKEAYPTTVFRDWNVRYRNGRGLLHVIDVQMNASRDFRLNQHDTEWLQKAHHELLPDDDEGFYLELFASDELLGNRRPLPGPLPPAVKKARAKTRLLHQHQVFKTTGKPKAKPAKAHKPERRHTRWMPKPGSTTV